jgi:hypothetical protein
MYAPGPKRSMKLGHPDTLPVFALCRQRFTYGTRERIGSVDREVFSPTHPDTEIWESQSASANRSAGERRRTWVGIGCVVERQWSTHRPSRGAAGIRQKRATQPPAKSDLG